MFLIGVFLVLLVIQFIVTYFSSKLDQMEEILLKRYLYISTLQVILSIGTSWLAGALPRYTY